MKKIPTEIKFLSDMHPEVEAFAIPVTEGVWYVYIDWYDAFELCGTGGGAKEESMLELYFSHPANDKGMDFMVGFDFPKDGFLFGEVTKKSYHGTFYDKDVYTDLIENKLPELLDNHPE